MLCRREEHRVGCPSEFDGTLEVLDCTFRFTVSEEGLAAVLSHHGLKCRTHALCDEHVVLAHGMSGVPEVAMAIGSKRPYSWSLPEHLEHMKGSAGVPGPQQFDRLGEGILSEAGSEGLQVVTTGRRSSALMIQPGPPATSSSTCSG
ncbi:hypothetical protein DEJ30_15940 [Curtobacterium sp. MCPF17_003]|nr:hypothetical protein DEJ30_15940 [Curtobacterium sp. MCPF17_003]